MTNHVQKNELDGTGKRSSSNNNKGGNLMVEEAINDGTDARWNRRETYK